MTYEEAVAYTEEIPRFTKKNTPRDTRAFYEYLGCPGESALIVHVAGTNGKGSVCAYVSTVLTTAGLRTGLFTSPHLVALTERFRLDGVQMSGEDYAALLEQVCARCEAFRQEHGDGSYHPTYFEMLFFIGMLWFKAQGAEAIVLETGLGGRLDATNVILHPAVCVITRIALDHMETLGNTRAEIAAEKAGIIKEGVPVVYWDGCAEASGVIRSCAGQRNAPAVAVSGADVRELTFRNKTVAFLMPSAYDDCVRLRLDTAAHYQWENAALAVRTLELLAGLGSVPPASAPIRLSRTQLEKGMAATRWEGRMEELLPGVFVDGAHNEDGIEAFVETVRTDGCSGERYLLFSAMKDKQVERMIEVLSAPQPELFSHIVVTRLRGGRGMEASTLRELWGGRADIAPDAGTALKRLIAERKEGDLIYAAGSLYLVGELKAARQLV